MCIILLDASGTSHVSKSDKTADISRRQNSVWKKGAQEFRTDDASLSRSRECFWSAENLLQQKENNVFLPQIRNTIQIWVALRHDLQYAIFVLVSQTSYISLQVGEKIIYCSNVLATWEHLPNKKNLWSLLLAVLVDVWRYICFFNGTINPELYGEPELLEIVQDEKYGDIHGRITAKTLMTISQNPLSLAIKVSPFMIFSFRKYVYSYKLPDLHFTVRLFLENVCIRE